MAWCAALLVAGAFFCCAAKAGSQESAGRATPAAATHDVMDEVGRTVHVPVNPLRVVSLAPSLTETIYALGAQERLVGDTIYCDYPPEAQKKPKVGGVMDPSLEKIAALHPDLVLAAANDANRLETVRALETVGIPTYATNAHKKIAEIMASTEKLAEVLNVPEAGKTVADEMQKRLTALQAKLNGVAPKNVLFVVWTEPLISVGRGTFVADALTRAGAVSVVDSAQDWPQVSLEEVAHLQPDFLIFAEAHNNGAEHDFDSLLNLPGWRILNAVKARRYAVVSDAVIRPAPRIVSAIEELARQLHPEAFAEPVAPEKSAPGPGANSAERNEFECGAGAGERGDLVETACAR